MIAEINDNSLVWYSSASPSVLVGTLDGSSWGNRFLQ